MTYPLPEPIRNAPRTPFPSLQDDIREHFECMAPFEPWDDPVLMCRHPDGCEEVHDHASWCECRLCIQWLLSRVRRSRQRLGPLSAWVEHEVISKMWVSMAEAFEQEPPSGELPGQDPGRSEPASG